jgi:hypothetical protein
MKTLLTCARSASPYLLVEVLLPGGSVIALLMWAIRSGRFKDHSWMRKITGWIPLLSR